MAEMEHKYMKLKKHTLSFIVALAVTFMAIESVVALEPPWSYMERVGNKVIIIWDTVDGATGYKLYDSYGKFSGDFDKSVDVGNVTSIEYDNLSDGTYFIAITAYDGNKRKRVFFNNIFYYWHSHRTFLPTSQHQ